MICECIECRRIMKLLADVDRREEEMKQAFWETIHSKTKEIFAERRRELLEELGELKRGDCVNDKLRNTTIGIY